MVKTSKNIVKNAMKEERRKKKVSKDVKDVIKVGKIAHVNVENMET